MGQTRILKFVSATAICLATSSLLVAGNANAGISVGVGINLAPPVDRVEVVPARPHDGYVWIRGHWRRDHGEWVWVGGHWDNPPRMGAVWVPGHWSNRRGEWVEGHWRY